MIGQVEISQWLSQLGEFLPFGYAFGAGMVSAVNPCGFAMLPVYLSLYLGANESDFHSDSLVVRFLRGVWVALVVTCGFGLLFGTVGAIVAAGGSFLMGVMPWFSLVIGIILIALGLWLISGRSLSAQFFLRVSSKIGDPTKITTLGFFLFGVAFGATSLSCTLPIFLLVIGSAITTGDFGNGITQFILYIFGMGTIMLILTLGIALVKEGVVVGVLRKALPHVHRVSAVLLLFAGGYIIYYWLSSGILFL